MDFPFIGHEYIKERFQEVVVELKLKLERGCCEDAWREGFVAKPIGEEVVMLLQVCFASLRKGPVGERRRITLDNINQVRQLNKMLKVSNSVDQGRLWGSEVSI